MIDEQLGMMPLESDNSTNPKELFDIEDIEGKTELTGEQVMIISRMKILGELYQTKYKLNYINKLVENFLTLQLSKDRKSRNEFVSAFQSKNDEKVGGLMDKFNFNIGK